MRTKATSARVSPPAARTDGTDAHVVEQALSDADRTASRSDRTTADSDQRASDRDQATADFDHDASADHTAAEELAYGASRDQREAATAERVENQAERALTARERALTGRYRAVLDAGPNGVLAIDPDGRISFVNRSLATMFGYDVDELLDRPLEMLLPARFSSHLAHRAAFLAQPTARQMAPGPDVVGRRRDGTEFPVDVSLSPVDTPEGVQVFATVVDTTARKAEESRRLHAHKLESMGRLTGGIAHDFNNMLFAIQGYAELLTRHLADVEPSGPRDAEVRTFVHEIARAADRASSLTAQVLAFSRHHVVTPVALDLDRAILGLVPMLRQVVGPRVEIRLDLDHGAGHILADPGWMDQILLNLVVNARDAMPDGGVVRIETSGIDGVLTGAVAGAAPASGRCAVLSVIDAGSGMDAATQARIFEPYFTTRAVGHGTGLGLATISGIVHEAGGRIAVTSALGHGSTFSVTFTQVDADESMAPAAATRHASEAPGRVLVVDDEAAIRDVMTRLLETAGWMVVAVPDGRTALTLLDGREPFDVLISDTMMPGMSGTELAARVIASHPRVRIVLMSGSGDATIDLAGLAASGVVLLPKPVSLEQLQAAMARGSRHRDRPGNERARKSPIRTMDVLTSPVHRARTGTRR